MKKTLAFSAVLLFFFTFVFCAIADAQQSQKKGEGPWPVYAITFGDGLIYTSLDGNTWTLRNSGTNIPLHSLVFGRDKFVAVGAKGTIVTGSRDGLNWNTVSSGVVLDLWAVIFAKNIFIAVGEDGVVITSPDGVTWTKNAVLCPGQIVKNITWIQKQQIPSGFRVFSRHQQHGANIQII